MQESRKDESRILTDLRMRVCVVGLTVAAACFYHGVAYGKTAGPAVQPKNDGTVGAEDALSATMGLEMSHIDIPSCARISLNRSDATYRCGDEAVFSVSVAEPNGAGRSSATIPDGIRGSCGRSPRAGKTAV